MDKTYESASLSPESEESSLGDVSVYINAGGRGTRLEPVIQKGKKGIVKALLELEGQPLIQHHIDLLSKFNFKNIVVGAGDHEDLAAQIKNRGKEVQVVTGVKELGTGGDLIQAVRERRDFGHLVLVENVDTLIYLKDIAELVKQHRNTGALATITLTTKKGVPNERAYMGDSSKRVLFTREADPKYGLHTVAEPAYSGSSTGIVLFDTEALRQLNWEPGNGALSIYRDILPQLIASDNLFYYDNENNFFVDIGTPKNLSQINDHSNHVLGALGQRYDNQINEQD